MGTRKKLTNLIKGKGYTEKEETIEEIVEKSKRKKETRSEIKEETTPKKLLK